MNDRTIDRGRIVRDIAHMFAGSMPTILGIDEAGGAALQADGLDSPKIICEICLFFHRAHDLIAQDAVLAEEVRVFIIAALDRLVTDAILVRIARLPSAVGLVSLILLCCRTYGIASVRLDAIERAVRSPAYLATEKTPFRYQEMIWLHEAVFGAEMEGQHGCPSALFSRPTHPCVLKREDLYAKTHSAMYESDFGRRPIHTAYHDAGIRDGLAHDLAFSFCNADWDLVGEICMAHLYLGAGGALYDQCRDALASVFAKFGFVPSITFDAAWATRLDARQFELYRFAHSYHSTLVFGILAACEADMPGQVEAGTSIDDIDDIESWQVLRAINQFFGMDEFTFGPLSQHWYADDPKIMMASLIDGYASKCYQSYGRDQALQFLAAIPKATEHRLVRSTRDYIERI
jgi:hypothetical protein